jgi:hypothetical protein
MTRKRRLSLILIIAGIILIVYGLIIAIVSFDLSGLELVYRLIVGIFITMIGIGLGCLGFKIKQSKK